MVLAAFSVTGLSLGASSSAPPKEGAPVGIITNKNGKTSTLIGSENNAGIPAPKTLPKWAKIYPGAKVISAAEPSDNTGGSVSYVSGDPIAKVAAFNDTTLAAAGKKPGPIADNATAAVRYVGKDASDGGGMIMMSREKNVTSVSILYSAAR